jgi:hypothetical protein
MSKSGMATVFLLALVLVSAGFVRPAPADVAGQASAVRDRCFKEDHLTGADYLWLRADGTYAITGREHMGVSELETGRWTRRGAGLTFTPSRKLIGGALKPVSVPYVATEVTHNTHTFLAFTDDEQSPALVIPVAETLEELKRSPDRRPPYVFFEIDQRTFDEETQETDPFRTLRRK